MKYKVINRFQDKDNKNHLYEVGDTYPKKGSRAKKERIAFLLDKHPTYKVVFIEPIEETKNNEPSSED